ncbi:2311_t:CDS:2 [Scutellospora calospora]|uniref:2311_t:CDS:1 n=1 Tax=Scutellospora calospora TaxID=85575 RepID=A0ACA9JVI7_9GLOM|nr:2311_t:CDS:2 [Scutellospora calospora]
MKLWHLKNDQLYVQIKDQLLRRFVPAWDLEFRQSLFNQFHDNDRHINANDCHKKIMEIDVQETLPSPQSVINHLEKVSVLHDEVNKQLDKTRKQMQKRSSVHHRNNPYESSQLVAIAPDTDMNPTT